MLTRVLSPSLPLSLPLLLLVSAVGCAENHTFRVAVRNETERPVTAGLAKDGGRYEPQWAAPEDVVVRTRSENERGWDSVVVPPGETRSAGPVTGDFAGDARAVLRVYAGDLELSEVLSVSRGSPDRLDVPLEPGRNAIVVREEKGRLAYERVKVRKR